MHRSTRCSEDQAHPAPRGDGEAGLCSVGKNHPMSVDEQLSRLGLARSGSPAGGETFEPVVVSGDTLYVSGQIATIEGRLVATGRVGAEVDVEVARTCAEACAVNLLTQLSRLPGGIERVDRLLKLTVFVACAPGFSEPQAAANGASELLLAVLGDRGRHARSAIGVARLPRDSPVEVEAIVRLRPE